MSKKTEIKIISESYRDWSGDLKHKSPRLLIENDENNFYIDNHVTHDGPSEFKVRLTISIYHKTLENINDNLKKGKKKEIYEVMKYTTIGKPWVSKDDEMNFEFFFKYVGKIVDENLYDREEVKEYIKLVKETSKKDAARSLIYLAERIFGHEYFTEELNSITIEKVQGA